MLSWCDVIILLKNLQRHYTYSFSQNYLRILLFIIHVILFYLQKSHERFDVGKSKSFWINWNK